MKYILMFCCLVLLGSGYAQTSMNIGAGLQATTSGALKTVLGPGSLANNGVFTDNSGELILTGPQSFSGNGVTKLFVLTVNNSSNVNGTTGFSATVSVQDALHLDAGALDAGANQLYIRTDLNGAASVTVGGVLTGEVKGLVTKATDTSGGCPSFNTTLSLNISGPVLNYQWQSSADNISFADIAGATDPVYTAAIGGETYIRCDITTSNSSFHQATPGRHLTLSGPPPAITADPFAIAVCSNVSASFYIAADHAPVSYIWEGSTNGGSSWTTLSDSTPYSGTETDTLKIDPSAGLDGNLYRCIAVNSCGSSAPSQAALLTVHDLPAVDAGADQTICAGNSTVLTAGGASAYSWDHGVINGASFTPASSAAYTVTGTDDNGCSNTDQVTVTLHNAVLNPSGTVAHCTRDTITITAPAGSAYTWKRNGVVNTTSTTNTLSVSNTGNYTLTYTDAYCGLRTVGPTTITNYPANPKPVISPLSMSVCPGGSVQFDGPSGFNYQWTFNGTPVDGATDQSYTATAAGSYALMTTDGNGCRSPLSRPSKMTVQAPPNTHFVVKKVNSNGSLLLQGAGGTVNYQWFLEDAPVAGATDKYYTATMSGNYSLQVTQSSGCYAVSPDSFIMVSYTGSKYAEEPAAVIEDSPVSVTPNPSSGIFHVMSSELLSARVLDMQGRVVLVSGKADDIDLTVQAAGLYLLQLFNGKGEMVRHEQLMKE